MTDYLNALEAGLVDAGRRLSARRRRVRHRRGACIAAVVVLAGAPALAATGVWRPQLGDPVRGKPTISNTKPPADQLALLSVLRRPQTDRDRGSRAREALRLPGSRITGIRTGSVRLLTQSAPDRGIVLIPVARYNVWPERLPADTPPRMRAQRAPKRDGLCLYALDGGGAGAGCYSTADIREGRAWLSVGHRVAWLVPDGVVSLHTELSTGGSVDALVHDNLAVYPEPRGGVRWVRTVWKASDGSELRVVTAPSPPPDPHPGMLPAHDDPLAHGALHSGVVRRVATRTSDGLLHVELLVRPPRGPRKFGRHGYSDRLTILLHRPACAGRRDVVERPKAVASISRRYPYTQIDITPSTGDSHRPSWCPGRYSGRLRADTGHKVVGTFSFVVK